jgi:toxin ParE1/3/4
LGRSPVAIAGQPVMSWLIRVRPEAEADLREAHQWYEQRRIGLGEHFILCVEDALERIRRNPQAYPVVHRETRRTLIRRFPYAVFYVVEESSIIIIAVMHVSRNPSQWKLRA